MNRILVILCIFIFCTTNSHSDSKFDKDLAKVSKDNGFIDNKGNVYSEEQITDKKNIILIIYNHGSTPDQNIDKCLKGWAKVPPVIRNLHDQKIKNFHVKIYRLCSGVRGWSKNEQTKMWKAHEKSGKLDLKLADKDGTPLIKKQKQNQKLKIIKKKVDSFIEQGFENIVLAGHSSGGWQSIKIKAEHPQIVKGVIALQSGAGGTVKNRKDWPWWEDVRYYGFGDLSKLNAIFVTHDKDQFNAPGDYSLFSNLSSVKLINITGSGCKGKTTLGGYHGIALTECFAEYEAKNKSITQYLEEIF